MLSNEIVFWGLLRPQIHDFTGKGKKKNNSIFQSQIRY